MCAQSCKACQECNPAMKTMSAIEDEAKAYKMAIKRVRLETQALRQEYASHTGVLVVDDSVELANAISHALELDLDCPVWTAYNASQAMELYVQHRPRVAIVDVHLGFDNGAKLAADLSRVTRVILTSADHEILDGIADDIQAEAIPRDPFHWKEYMAKLVETVQRLCERRHRIQSYI